MSAAVKGVDVEAISPAAPPLAPLEAPPEAPSTTAVPMSQALTAILPPWLEALLAMLPHLWVAAGTALLKFFPADPAHTSGKVGYAASMGLLAAFIVFLVGALWTALRQVRAGGDFPLWASSWVGYAIWLPVTALGFIVYWAAGHAWVLTALLILGALGGIAVGVLLIFRKARRHALLLALFLMPVATQFDLEAIPDAWEALYGALVGILAAGTAAAIVRLGSWGKGVVLAISANVLAGAVLTYICFYQVEIPGFYGEGILYALGSFMSFVVLVCGLFLGPVIFWTFWDTLMRRREQRRAMTI